MPHYTLICSYCQHKFPEKLMTMAEREKAYCTECGGAESLGNDYTRHLTSHFQLTGDSWPGKTHRLEGVMRKLG